MKIPACNACRTGNTLESHTCWPRRNDETGDLEFSEDWDGGYDADSYFSHAMNKDD